MKSRGPTPQRATARGGDERAAPKLRSEKRKAPKPAAARRVDSELGTSRRSAKGTASKPRAARPRAKPRKKPASDWVGGRGGQLRRVLEILARLHDLRFDGVDAYTLARDLNVAVRTVKRDLEMIEQAGLAVVGTVDGSRGRKKLWRIDTKRPLSELGTVIGARHYLALEAAARQMSVAGEEGFVPERLRELADAIEKALGPQKRSYLEAVYNAFFSFEKWTYLHPTPDVVMNLVDAIAQRRLCDITYRAPRPNSTDKVHRVLPLRLFAFRDSLYLLAYAPKRRREITLHLHRVRKLRVLSKRGKPPKDFDLDAWRDSAFGLFTSGTPATYRLRFDPDAAPFIRERRWHSTQQLTELPDGGVELRFECVESFEVRTWVASWEDHVEVLAPTSVRRELRALGDWLTNTYGRRAKSTKTA